MKACLAYCCILKGTVCEFTETLILICDLARGHPSVCSKVQKCFSSQTCINSDCEKVRNSCENTIIGTGIVQQCCNTLFLMPCVINLCLYNGNANHVLQKYSYRKQQSEHLQVIRAGPEMARDSK